MLGFGGLIVMEGCPVRWLTLSMKRDSRGKLKLVIKVQPVDNVLWHSTFFV